MTVYHKTPMARKAAWDYCRRALAFMLCLVLLSGFAMRTAPRAAAIVDGTSAYEIVDAPHLTVLKGGASGGTSSAASAVTGSTIGAFLLAACGINMMVDSIEYSTTRYSGGTVYEEGNELWAYLYDLGGDIADWCINTEALVDPAGIFPGFTFGVPGEVAEAARQWAISNIDFSDDSAVIYTSKGIISDGQWIAFSQFPDNAVYGAKYRVAFGTVFATPSYGDFASYTFFDKNGVEFKYEFDGCNETTYEIRFFRDGVSKGVWKYGYGSSFYTFCLCPNSKTDTDRSLCFKFVGYDGIIQYLDGVSDGKVVFMRESNFPDGMLSTSTTMTKTPALDQPKTEDITITIPQELPTTQVGELTIPVITEITSTDLTEIGGEKDPSTDPQPGAGLTPGQITQAVKDALPVTGSQLGDDVLEETLTEPATLGGAIITKFPFSIPWDVVKAVKLFASPPVTPRWELDFMAPISDRVGGFAGDTTVVLDFSDYEIIGVVSRWVSTVLFIYALASGTKKLLWTA